MVLEDSPCCFCACCIRPAAQIFAASMPEMNTCRKPAGVICRIDPTPWPSCRTTRSFLMPFLAVLMPFLVVLHWVDKSLIGSDGTEESGVKTCMCIMS